MKLAVPAVILVLAVCDFAQTVSPNSWRGLTLDESTRADVVEKFGETKNVKDNQKLDRTLIDKLLSKDVDKKIFTRLHYESIEGFDDVKLYFRGEKLVMIRLEPTEQPRPNSVINAYGLPFRPQFSSFEVALNKGDFARDGSGNIYAKSYPTDYHLFAENDDAFIVLRVFRSALGKIFADPTRPTEGSLNYPGKTAFIELISKSLEDKSAVEILK